MLDIKEGSSTPGVGTRDKKNCGKAQSRERRVVLGLEPLEVTRGSRGSSQGGKGESFYGNAGKKGTTP